MPATTMHSAPGPAARGGSHCADVTCCMSKRPKLSDLGVQLDAPPAVLLVHT